jgi:16S rRNA (adenine1518-N6/adenine1519-N6)-dimethyltransferase
MQFLAGPWLNFDPIQFFYMATPKEIITQYGIRPRKKLGQSFLLDQNIIRKIVATANINEEDVVVEIGAGTGVLKELLAGVARQVIAVELDMNLVKILRIKLADYNNVDIHSGDILKFDFTSISSICDTKLKVIGNVPYNISSPLIFRLLSFRSSIENFILMLQKEVVQRLVAKPNNKSYGIPSILMQMFTTMEKLFEVPSTCFYPQPKVESAVLKGTFLDSPLVKLSSEAFFIQLVKASFAFRRKTLINNLKHAKTLTDVSEENIRKIISAAGIDGNCRGESLSVEEFGKLSNYFRSEIA